MADPDVVFAKLATLDRCVGRIGEVRKPGRRLTAVDIEDITDPNLQRAVQAAIDLAAHVVASEG